MGDRERQPQVGIKYEGTVRIVTSQKAYVTLENFPEYVGMVEQLYSSSLNWNGGYQPTSFTEILTINQNICVLVLEKRGDSSLRLEYNEAETRKMARLQIENSSSSIGAQSTNVEDLLELLTCEKEKFVKVESRLDKVEQKANQEYQKIRFFESIIDRQNDRIDNVLEPRIKNLERENELLTEERLFWKNGVEFEISHRAGVENELSKKELEYSKLKSYKEDLEKDHVYYLEKLLSELQKSYELSKKHLEYSKLKSCKEKLEKDHIYYLEKLLSELHISGMKHTKCVAQKNEIKKLHQMLELSGNSLILLSKKHHMLKSKSVTAKENADPIFHPKEHRTQICADSSLSSDEKTSYAITEYKKTISAEQLQFVMTVWKICNDISRVFRNEIEELEIELISKSNEFDMTHAKSLAQENEIKKLQQMLERSDNSLILLSEQHQILKSKIALAKANPEPIHNVMEHETQICTCSKSSNDGSTSYPLTQYKTEQVGFDAHWPVARYQCQQNPLNGYSTMVNVINSPLRWKRI